MKTRRERLLLCLASMAVFSLALNVSAVSPARARPGHDQPRGGHFQVLRHFKRCRKYGYTCIPQKPGHGTLGGVNRRFVAFQCVTGPVSLHGRHRPGTPIVCQLVPSQAPCPGETARTIVVHGTDLDLTLLTPGGGSLFLFDPATGNLTPVGSVHDAGGIYVIITGSCAKIPTTLPITGGAGTI